MSCITTGMLPDRAVKVKESLRSDGVELAVAMELKYVRCLCIRRKTVTVVVVYSNNSPGVYISWSFSWQSWCRWKEKLASEDCSLSVNENNARDKG
jgi:hypothetical protein